MLAARNRCFRIAAGLIAAALLTLAARYIVEAAHLSEYSAAGGYVVSTVLLVVGNLVGALGWFVVAGSFGPEIDWRRLRLGAAIIVATYFALYGAQVLRVILVLDHDHDGNYRGIYIATALSALLLAVGAALFASGFGDARRGEVRALRLWLGSMVATAAFLASAIGALFQQSYYSSQSFAHEFAVGSLIMAVGALGSALAAVIFTVGARRPLVRREASLAAAAVGGALASICTIGGEAVFAVTYSTKGAAPAWESTSLWLSLAGRAISVGALVAVALGARAVATSAGG
jgi:hypothetical protein